MIRRGVSVRSERAGVTLPALLALLALVVLAGCASGQDTVALPSLDAAVESSSLSSSPDPSPTAVSDEKVQVEAAVRAYFAAATTAAASGDTRTLRSAATSRCTCNALAKEIERAYSAGSIAGAGWRINAISAGLLEMAIASAEVSYESAAHQVLDSEGLTVSAFPGHRVEALIQLQRQNGTWLVSDVDHISRVEM
jgi:hypothetical protein